MRRLSRLAWMALLMVATLNAMAQQAPASEQRKIDSLIQSVAQLHGAQFIRNGSSYDASAAVHQAQATLRGEPGADGG